MKRDENRFGFFFLFVFSYYPIIQLSNSRGDSSIMVNLFLDICAKINTIYTFDTYIIKWICSVVTGVKRASSRPSRSVLCISTALIW